MTALIRSLPKAVRRSFVPAPEHAVAALSRMRPLQGSITTSLARALEAAGGVRLEDSDFDWERVPAHLRMTFRVVGDGGRVLGEGKDLTALQDRLAPKIRAIVSAGASDLERPGLRTWESGTSVPRRHEHVRDGRTVTGFPALVDEGATVALRVLASEAEQRAAMRAGTRRLLLLNLNPPLKAVLAGLDNRARLALAAAPHPSGSALFADCVDAAVDALVDAAGGPAWEGAAFDALLRSVRAGLADALARVVADVVTILTVAQDVDARLARASTASAAAGAALADMRAHYTSLVHPGFVAAAGARRLPDVARYLRGIGRRLDKLAAGPDADQVRTATVTQLEREYGEMVAALPPGRRNDPDVAEIRWMLEELRVSLFAQSLGTAYPVSEKRVLKAMDAAEQA